MIKHRLVCCGVGCTDCGLAPGYVVSQDLSKVPTSMPKEGEVEVDEDEGVEREGGEKTKGKVSTGKDALGDSAKLKAWLSS